METNKTNILPLVIWLAENGDSKARTKLCHEAGLSASTLSNILNRGRMPKFSIRYRIYKLTGIKLNDLDEFPEQKQNAS
jgi:transcriptional regulator with XRE-family HTH domain